MKSDRQILDSEYNEILLQTVAVIEKSRSMLAVQVSTIASNSYFGIGQILYERKLESKYGDAVVRRLSVDLKQRYPNMGMSPRQLWNMKAFYCRYKDSDEKLLRAVALLPWSSNLLLMSKDLTDEQTLFYAQETIRKGWNRDLMLNAIQMKMHKNAQCPVDNNFAQTLPAVQSEYANEVFHDGYNLGFLDVTEPIAELELERRLVEKIKLFLLELGRGFTFVGNQYELEYEGKTSRVDMLFFHRKLRCLVAVDLKIGGFIPEYAGKMNYYLSLWDRTERLPDDNPSIGIILCPSIDKTMAEYTLSRSLSPTMVSEYQRKLIPRDVLVKSLHDYCRFLDQEISNNMIDKE